MFWSQSSLLISTFVLLLAQIHATENSRLFEDCIRQCANPCGENCDNTNENHPYFPVLHGHPLVDDGLWMAGSSLAFK
ncbi:hypothetical protein Q1695_001795 [Nippostrongylus brasiliensis]|nr:hypothetical protein Q1695_001795 [Nippostrongylus brasiliensis]